MVPLDAYICHCGLWGSDIVLLVCILHKLVQWILSGEGAKTGIYLSMDYEELQSS